MNNEKRDEVVYLYLDDIIPNRFQPREVFDEKALKELAVSIREHGVIQPIIVRSVNGKYEIIAGERRYKASVKAGLTKIPAIIRNLDDKESSKVALLENLQRKNLNPIEEARTFQKILEIDQMTQEQLAKTMGKSQPAVANKLRLLSLPEEVQTALLKEEISERHARSLLNIPDPSKQKEMLKKIIANKMSVRSVEEEIKRMYNKEDSINEDITTSNIDNNFVNQQPLAPTTDLGSMSDNYGKVTYSPMEGDTTAPQAPQFINYGEVNGADITTEEAPTQLNLNSSVEQIDVDKVKEDTNDIDSYDNSQAGGLDSLLNIGNNSGGPSIGGDEFNFITPAEGIIKQETEEPKDEENSGDYFKPMEEDGFNPMMTNNIDVTQQESVIKNDNFVSNDNFTSNDTFENPNNSALNELYSNDNKFTIEDAQNKIRELADDLKKHGIEITTDEMNFEKTYQVIIKIVK